MASPRGRAILRGIKKTTPEASAGGRPRNGSVTAMCPPLWGRPDHVRNGTFLNACNWESQLMPGKVQCRAKVKERQLRSRVAPAIDGTSIAGWPSQVAPQRTPRGRAGITVVTAPTPDAAVRTSLIRIELTPPWFVYVRPGSALPRTSRAQLNQNWADPPHGLRSRANPNPSRRPRRFCRSLVSIARP